MRLLPDASAAARVELVGFEVAESGKPMVASLICRQEQLPREGNGMGLGSTIFHSRSAASIRLRDMPDLLPIAVSMGERDMPVTRQMRCAYRHAGVDWWIVGWMDGCIGG